MAFVGVRNRKYVQAVRVKVRRVGLVFSVDMSGNGPAAVIGLAGHPERCFRVSECVALERIIRVYLPALSRDFFTDSPAKLGRHIDHHRTRTRAGRDKTLVSVPADCAIGCEVRRRCARAPSDRGLMPMKLNRTGVRLPGEGE